MYSPSPVGTLRQTCSLPPSYPRSRNWKEHHLSAAFYAGGLDRVNVLGSDSYGHTGCVNALSWARNGDVLISSGDDTTIRLWQMDPHNVEDDYPFKCDTIIHTGHRANVFNAQMLPHSSRIATVAGDNQVRVFDHEKAAGSPRYSGEIEYSTRAAVIRILRCHKGRTKRIVTEDSPDLFLTVAEDGTVRQHDLRVPHSCNSQSCPAPLIRVNHELSTVALSPLTPYQLVVAGSSPYGYLFDRRHAGRQFREEWGQPPDDSEVTSCVRRFGRKSRGQYERIGLEHITGARMASSNGHEVLLSYSSDAIYLYSTRDDPTPTSIASKETSILPSNKRSRRSSQGSAGNSAGSEQGLSEEQAERDTMMEADIERISSEASPSPSREEQQPLLESTTDDDDLEMRMMDDEDDEDEEDEEEANGDTRYNYVPTVMPRSRFAGVCNVRTVKDVNFIGPRDEFVVSGSDDGHWFIWEKTTGRLHDILEGDGTVVNVIEAHPTLPLVAVSGIDHSVKLFAPTPGPSRFSRMDKAESIVEHNVRAARPQRSDLNSLLLYYRLARRMSEEGGGELPDCNTQ